MGKNYRDKSLLSSAKTSLTFAVTSEECPNHQYYQDTPGKYLHLANSSTLR